MDEILQKIFGIIRYPWSCILVIFLLAGRCVVAQCTVWPEYLNVPESGTGDRDLCDGEPRDSNWLKINNRFSWYETAKEINTIDWRVETAKYEFSQQSQYLLKMDNRETREHTYSLPGSISRKNLLIPSGKLGVEWVPKFNYRVRADSSTFHSTIDVGPVAEAEVLSVPIKIRTGVSTDVWDEAINGNDILSVLDDYLWDAGYYLEGEFGDYSKPVLDMPLYFSLRASGRSIRDADLGLIMGNVLYSNDLGGGDSIVFYISDSLSNGRESYLSQGTTFQTSSWRILHNFLVSGGIKFDERLGFCPSGYYSYNLRTIKYPAETELYNDMKGRYHKAGMQLTTHDRYFFNYSGGIELGWNKQDWMYTNENISTRITSNSSSDSDDKALLLATANNKDNLTFTAGMGHDVVIPLIWKFSFLYNFNISRESKNYYNYFLYIENGIVDTVRNQLESDGVEKSHHFEISRRDSGMISGGAYCDYGKILIHNLREESSGESRTRRTMKIGGFAGCLLGKIQLNEELFFMGEKNDYVFKSLHTDPSKRPYQQRDFYSMLSGAWSFNDMFKLVCSWNERYGDDGKWYGEEYIAEDTAEYDYYAIQNKKNDFSVSIQLEMYLSNLHIIVGGSFRDTYKRRYNASEMVYTPVQEGYYYIPFVEWETGFSGLYIKGKIKRNFNTIDPERWDKYKNWDISLFLQKEW